jgi:hypothetical protein
VRQPSSRSRSRRSRRSRRVARSPTATDVGRRGEALCAERVGAARDTRERLGGGTVEGGSGPCVSSRLSAAPQPPEGASRVHGRA